MIRGDIVKPLNISKNVMQVKRESFFYYARNWVILERYMMKLSLEMKVTRFLPLSHSQIDMYVFFKGVRR